MIWSNALKDEKHLFSRRKFLAHSAAALSLPLVGACAAQPPASLRRNQLQPPHRRPRQVLALTSDRTGASFSPAPSTSPQALGERVAGLYPSDSLAPWINLTFDDGPKPDWTPRVLSLLAEYGVTATFFVVGRLAEAHPDIIKRIVGEGHLLGNHTYSHANLAVRSTQGIRDELDRAQDAVDKALGYHHRLDLVRPPYGSPWFGAWSQEACDRVADVINERNGFCILWHIGTSDTRPECTTADMVHGLSRAISRGKGGSMILHPTKCARQSVRSVLRLMQREEVGTATPFHLLEAKYDCEWRTIATLPTNIG